MEKVTCEPGPGGEEVLRVRRKEQGSNQQGGQGAETPEQHPRAHTLVRWEVVGGLIIIIQ